MRYNRVLTIAGSDSGGGAGIQADIKTISACACFATSAITAITAQNTLGVTEIHEVPTSTVIAQIEAVISDIGTDAVKIGMLSSSEIILEIDKYLKNQQIKNIVVDPVMISTSGHKLIADSAIETLKNTLLYNARVITPNIPEAEVLLGEKISENLVYYAKKLSFAKNINGNQNDDRRVSVFLKAGHLKSDSLVDILYNAESDEILELESQRLYTKNTHGTGCTLSSAIASKLAKGLELNEASKQAKDYITKALVAGVDYEIGEGHGPVKHFYEFW